ncbi:MAG TPA: hypothetical protein VFB45_18135 [Pseudolabrys sp.]|nr:hypothetical protein [Pseudolabrys sp.]
MRALSVTKRRVLMVATAALMLAGCGNSEMFSSGSSSEWFSKKFDLFERPSGMAQNKATGTTLRAATAEDFVGPDGSCPLPTNAAAPADPNSGAGTVAGDLAGAPAPAAAAPMGGGVALLMTECEVVNRLGRPQQVDIGAGQGGERAATLTYLQGDRPGIYHFAAGRLKEIDRGPEPEPPPKPAKGKKKPAKPKTASLPKQQ